MHPTLLPSPATPPKSPETTGKHNVAVMNLVISGQYRCPRSGGGLRALFDQRWPNQLSFAKAANVLPSTVAALKDEYFTASAGDTSGGRKRPVPLALAR